jgi:hypothetical protein
MSITINKLKQINYLHFVQNIGINVVCCHTCPSVFFYKIGETELVCPYCLAEGKSEDFSDLVHE